MHEVLVNPLGGLSLPRKSVVRLTDRPNMTVKQQCNNNNNSPPHTPKDISQCHSAFLAHLYECTCSYCATLGQGAVRPAILYMDRSCCSCYWYFVVIKLCIRRQIYLPKPHGSPVHEYYKQVVLFCLIKSVGQVAVNFYRASHEKKTSSSMCKHRIFGLFSAHVYACGIIIELQCTKILH